MSIYDQSYDLFLQTMASVEQSIASTLSHAHKDKLENLGDYINSFEKRLEESLAAINTYRAVIAGYNEPIPADNPTIDFEQSVLETIAGINSRRPTKLTGNLHR